MKDKPGYVTSLFELSMSSELAPHMRQLCAVEFKNGVRKRWLNKVSKFQQETVLIGEEERVFVKAHLVDAIVACLDDKVCDTIVF
jgi:hypothetical protein